MEMPTVLRVNLVLLVLGTFVLNFAIASAWASSANGATQEQVQSFQSGMQGNLLTKRNYLFNIYDN